MTRPHSSDLPVRMKAAEAALPAVADWFEIYYDTEERDEMLNQIADAFTTSCDGYEICRRLELRYGWSPDAELVEIFDQQFLWDAEREAILEWVETAEMKPEYQIGDRVSFNWHGGGGGAVGIISDLNLEMATYSVGLDHPGAFALVPFEKAKLVPPVATETVQSDETLPDKVAATDTRE